MKPLAIDLFCGLGGWTEGLLAEDYYVVGFDIERHDYGTGGYPAQLVLQSVSILHGSQFKDAALIVASPPCQEFSYMAMPWSKAKAKERDLLEGRDDPKRLTALFDACFRIQREACEAAGHHIPMIVENVRGAQKWVGRSRWNYGSFHLWGDVPALMPMTQSAGKSPPGNSVGAPLLKDRAINSLSHATLTDHAREWYGMSEASGIKVGGISFSGYGTPGYKAIEFNGTAQQRIFEWNKNFAFQQARREGFKGVPSRPTEHWTNPAESAIKQGGDWFNKESGNSISRTTGSKSKARKARKAASAMIAKIPFQLSRYIAAHFKPVI